MAGRQSSSSSGSEQQDKDKAASAEEPKATTTAAPAAGKADAGDGKTSGGQAIGSPSGEVVDPTDEIPEGTKAPEETGAAKVGQENQAEVAAQKRGASSPGGVDSSGQELENVYVIKAGQPVTLEGVDEGGDIFVTVAKDVVLEFFPPGTKRPSHQLLFHAGQTVLKSELTKYEDDRQTVGLAARDTRTAGQV